MNRQPICPLLYIEYAVFFEENSRTKILVTGELGHHTLNFLLQRVPASDVAALARVNRSATDFITERAITDFPEPVAVFLASWMQAIAAGEFAEVTNDLEKLIGHPATRIEDILPTLGLSIVE